MKNIINEKYYIIISVIAIMVLIFSCWFYYGYWDMGSLTAWTVEIWDALFSGRINEYFLVTAENVRRCAHGGNSYGILYLLPWAIWNIPIYLLDKNYTIGLPLSPISLFWSRLFLCLCAIITAYCCTLIIKRITQNKELSQIAFFYSISAGSLISSIGYSGQDEIVYVMSLILGVYFLLCERKKVGYFFLICSVILFNLMIIPVLAIFLLEEKNFIKIGALLLFCFIPERIISYLCGSSDIAWLFSSDEYTVASEFCNFKLSSLIDILFNSNSIKLGVGDISLFAILIILLYAYCYLTKAENELRQKLLLFIPTIILTLGFCLLPNIAGFYRYIMPVPFIVCAILICGYKKNDISIGLFLLTIYEFFKFCILLYDSSFLMVAFTRYSEKYENILSIISKFIPDIENMRVIFLSCYASTIILLMIYLCEKRTTIKTKFPQRVINTFYLLLPIGIIVLSYITCMLET